MKTWPLPHGNGSWYSLRWEHSAISPLASLCYSDFYQEQQLRDAHGLGSGQARADCTERRGGQLAQGFVINSAGRVKQTKPQHVLLQLPEREAWATIPLQVVWYFSRKHFSSNEADWLHSTTGLTPCYHTSVLIPPGTAKYARSWVNTKMQRIPKLTGTLFELIKSILPMTRIHWFADFTNQAVHFSSSVSLSAPCTDFLSELLFCTKTDFPGYYNVIWIPIIRHLSPPSFF